MDERTYKYLGFEMRKGEVEGKETMKSSKRELGRSWKNHGHGPQEQRGGLPARARPAPHPIQVGNHLPPGVVLKNGGVTKRHGKGIWLREIEKVLRRFNASLEWLMERISLRDEEMDRIRADTKMEEREKSETLKAWRTKSIAEVLEEVEVLVDTRFFNEFSKTKSSVFLKKVIAHQSAIDLRLFRKTWRTLNCSPKTMKVIREIQENLPCVGKRKERIRKKKVDSKCWCSKSGLAVNAKHIVSCCKKVTGEKNARMTPSLTSSSTTSSKREDCSPMSRGGRTGR